MKKTAILGAAIALSASAFAQNALVETRAYYSTNPDGAVGKAAAITIDGQFSDWSEDMIIATCGANDMGTTFKGSHENNVLDMYALFASWDDDNLYIAWQMCNTGDTWAREGDGPLTDYGHIGNVPLIVALSVDPSSTGMTGLLEDGRCIWCDQAGNGTTFDPSKVHVDHILYMSGQPGQGVPAMFVASNTSGATNYGAACKEFASNGITYNIKNDFLPSHLWRQRTCAEWADATTLISDPSIINNIYDADNYDNLEAGPVEGLKPHDHSYDSFYELKIPFKALGINREWLEANGVGCRVIGTRGESAIDCIPFDPSMVDNVFAEYSKDPSTTGEKDDLDVITYAMADIAKIRDLANIDPVPDPTPDPTPTPDPDPQPVVDGNYVAYFDNSASNWGTVSVWAWDAAHDNKGYTGASWPGQAISLDAESGYYKFACEVTDENPNMMIIFSNNGGSQTADLPFYHNGIYNASGFTGQYYQSGVCSAVVSDEAVEAVYYNLQGVRVEAPAAGLYIVVRGNEVSKEYKK